MRLLDEADDLKFLRCGEPHVWSPPSPIMLFLSSRNSSACSATTSFRSCASRLSCLTSSVVAARAVSPPSRRLLASRNSFDQEQYMLSAIPSRRQSSAIELSPQAVEHNADLLFGRVVLPGCPPDVADKRLGRRRGGVGFLSHLRSLRACA